MNGHTYLLGRVAVDPGRGVTPTPTAIGNVVETLTGGILIECEGGVTFKAWGDISGWSFYEQHVWQAMQA